MSERQIERVEAGLPDAEAALLSEGTVPAPVPRSPWQKAWQFAFPKARQIFQFATRQGLAMVGNMVYGLLCVRLLPKPEYAKFAVLFGFMGSLTVLLDVGISGTLAPLVGERIEDLRLIANYIASLRSIALRMYLLVAPVAGLIFVLIVHKQHWGAWVVAQMLAVLLFTAWFARVSSSYGAVLILRRDRARYYRAQMMGSLGSLTLLIICWAMHWLNIYVSILLNVAQILFIATTYYKRSYELLGTRGQASQPQRKGILKLALPNVPSTVFYAVQAQITLMLITLFGHSSSSVADIGALGRLSQAFLFLGQMYPILVEPYFARLNAARLKRTYLLAVVFVSSCLALFAVFAFLFPSVFLWVLGPNYSQLRIEVGLAILGSAIQYTGGFLWVVHSSRRFVYWWNNLANVCIIFLVQVYFIWKFDMSTVRNVLILNIATAAASLLVNVACGFYGFWFGPQKIEEATA